MAPLLSELPAELLHLIVGYLPNKGIKALRLTCRTLCNAAQLRLDRVFLSANPLNIAVFRAVADSDTYRHGVKEIVWDDARLEKPPPRNIYRDEAEEIEDPQWEDDQDHEWFIHEMRWNKEYIPYRKGGVGPRSAPEDPRLAPHLANELPPRVCWQYYQNILQQQEDVINFNKDAEALWYGLKRFPALERITLTPAAHGWLWAPVYETPMIRAFPKGFNYPIPRGWTNGRHVWSGTPARPWEDPEVRATYRGFGIITRALTEYPEHQISELVIDVNYLETGLNCRVFEEPSAEYYDFGTILQRPGFRRLDLALYVRGEEHTGWRCYRSRLLSRALANAHDLEHFSLHTNVSPDAATDTTNYSGGDPRAGWVPLRIIVPVESWHSLRHFGLSGFHVDKDDLIELLELMPAIHSLFLGHLYFVDNGGCFRELLDDMRDKLDWRARDPAARPTISISVPTDYQQIGHAVWVDKEVAEFMYGEGPNPWLRSGRGSIVTPHGVIRDAFLPGAEWSTWPFDD
ncbi:hypothetical protein ASPCAL00713 [Aspergillus calidoustus]|uniref:F-box domain-containing protein n=1 Tax=Aspergillus calidoustus TaxID=454130 RepID=A0A0U5FNN3_ASPCI|nr:hypothetical protein ASPCAL00713 [Aspergillus calidoustus]